MCEMDKSFLSVENLVVEYSSGGDIVHAVNGVSFHWSGEKRWDWWERPVQAKQPLQNPS